MRTRVFALSFLTTAVVITACSDLVQPVAVSSVSGGDAGALTSMLVAPVKRATPLSADVTWSFVAGPAGVTSQNAASGLAVMVPAGALTQTVTITVTALAGDEVAYRFEPHGLQFARSVYLTQDLTHASLGLLTGLALSGAYFATDTLEVSVDGLVSVTEIIGAVTNPLTRTATFPIRHFSGYILASGRDSTTEE